MIAKERVKEGRKGRKKEGRNVRSGGKEDRKAEKKRRKEKRGLPLGEAGLKDI